LRHDSDESAGAWRSTGGGLNTACVMDETAVSGSSREKIGSHSGPEGQAIERAIGAWSPALVDLTSDLISIPTENPPGAAYPACLRVLSHWFDRLDLPFERVELAPGRSALLSSVGSGDTLVLHGHYDVVPATTEGQFEPEVVDGRLFGRGSSDMKGGIAAMMLALRAVRDLELPGRVELALVPDEETGGRLGTKRLLELGRLGRGAVGAIIGEPTSGAIWNAHRGALTLRVESRGQPAHVGLQHEGRNAFEAAVPVLSALLDLKRSVEERRTGYNIDPDPAKHSILMLGGEVEGGHQFNLVPERFGFTVERRMNPEEDHDTERERLTRTIANATPDGATIGVSVIQDARSSAAPEDSTPARALSHAVRSVTRSEPSFEMCPGLLESRFYGQVGVPALAYGPGDLELSHGPDESVAIERLVECMEIYVRTAIELFSGTART
jgi:succinyl-diaminopimelate desuccinylase